MAGFIHGEESNKFENGLGNYFVAHFIQDVLKRLKSFYCEMHSITAHGNIKGHEIWLLYGLVSIRVYNRIFKTLKRGEREKKDKTEKFEYTQI